MPLLNKNVHSRKIFYNHFISHLKARHVSLLKMFGIFNGFKNIKGDKRKSSIKYIPFTVLTMK